MVHVNKPFKGSFSFVFRDKTSLVVFMYGQTLHGLLQACIPRSFLFVWLFFGTLAWHNILFRLSGCLNAIIGGLGKQFLAFESLIMVFQCFYDF